MRPLIPDHLRSLIRSGPEPDETLGRFQALADSGALATVGAQPEALALLAGISPPLFDGLARHPEWWSNPPEFHAGLAGATRARMARIALDDVAGRDPLTITTKRLSDLADEVAEAALSQARTSVSGRFPAATDLPFAVIALGKWGGAELNYASDIDLLFVHGSDGSEEGAEAAGRLAAAFMTSVSAVGPDGFAFRVDADLRPEGSTGPLTRSLDSYGSYYRRWAATWEYQALLKARPAAGDPSVGAGFMDMVGPIVWGENLGADEIRTLRELKSRAEQEADPADIKRSPGGIRDIEFSVQLLQLIHGRHDPGLRRGGTEAAIAALTEGGYIRDEDADSLRDSYVFWRTVEHRLQLANLTQTHLLPGTGPARERLARALGYRPAGGISPTDRLDQDLGRHRASVRGLHEAIFFRPLLEAFASSPGAMTPEMAARRLRALGYDDVDGAARAFDELTHGLSRRSRLMTQLLPLMLDWMAASPNPDLGLEQLRLLVANADSAQLVSHLRDRPAAGQRLCLLLGSSRMVGEYLDRIPEFMPRLADEATLADLPGPELATTALERVKVRQTNDERLGSLRRFVRRRRLRIAAADLLDQVDLLGVQASLTATADAAVEAALWVAAQQAGPTPLAVIAVGRWGGGELGYGSDLDLLFVFAEGEQQADALRLATEAISTLSAPTADGVAYRIDTELMPEGRRGPIARSLDAFANYHEKWGEGWERLALLRARPATGDPAVCAAFEQLIAGIIYRPLPADDAREIRQIKARIEKERIPTGEDPDFHLKLGRGGLNDVEFLVQLMQLRHGHEVESLRTPSTLGALDALRQAAILPASECDLLEEAWTFCSRVRNRLFLQSGRAGDSLPVDLKEGARLARSLGYQSRADLREEHRRLTRRARQVFEKRFFEDV
ncbi:MAG TPA: bifunctional [glutamine synthetase] adenylyltransferase/[glutamine synthetase]-adenylyl-L-tyrosine phosphorylase [Acidimicrobiia bacterium]